jgi:hypothetical protein
MNGRWKPAKSRGAAVANPPTVSACLKLNASNSVPGRPGGGNPPLLTNAVVTHAAVMRERCHLPVIARRHLEIYREVLGQR